MPASDRNNTNFRMLRGTLGLSRSDVVAAMRLGGVEVSGDRVNRWARSSDAGAGRYTPMSDQEFDAFVRGVSALLARERGVSQEANPD